MSMSKRMSMKKAVAYLQEAVYTIYSIVKGHVVTIRYLFRPKVTLMYPEVKWDLPEGYRGVPALPVDPATGVDPCIGCQACVRICPPQLLTVDTHTGEDKKRVVDAFHARIGLCMFCGLCADVCPVDAIRMSKSYELAVFSKDDLHWDRARLNEVGGVRPPRPEPEPETDTAATTPGKEVSS
jgi:NADH-quinone oxidoreductase subunit I